jgi:hypothetical protein
MPGGSFDIRTLDIQGSVLLDAPRKGLARPTTDLTAVVPLPVLRHTVGSG